MKLLILVLVILSLVSCAGPTGPVIPNCSDALSSVTMTIDGDTVPVDTSQVSATFCVTRYAPVLPLITNSQ